ncbi:MAG TPA: hypothetical protein VJJ48_02525 [Candidatus Paceibacterota bacterium]
MEENRRLKEENQRLEEENRRLKEQIQQHALAHEYFDRSHPLSGGLDFDRYS